MQKIKLTQIYRIIDANVNRAKEGLRVCEDICRFLFDTKSLTAQYRDIRHELSSIIECAKITQKSVIRSRGIERDVGKASLGTEFKRGSVYDIFYANSQRSKESLRVLEEFLKLIDKKQAQKIKQLRYSLYALEKKVVRKF